MSIGFSYHDGSHLQAFQEEFFTQKCITWKLVNQTSCVAWMLTDAGKLAALFGGMSTHFPFTQPQ